MAQADDKPQKINIGFDGGQVLSARVAPTELTKLREALGSGSSEARGWHDVTSEEGTIAISLGSVVYVIVAHEGQRVGFGT